jgi:uncharacterized protein YjdB
MFETKNTIYIKRRNSMKTMSVKVFTRIACLIMAVAMAVSLVGCGVDITSVGLPTDIVLEKGETQQLNIEYGTDDKAEQEKIAEAASKLNLTWSSSDEEVATVDETGLVTAVGAGEADITVSVADANISSTTHIKVVILPTGVEAPETLSLELNGEATKALGAKMTPEDATDVKLAYLSSDESVATVDESGNVTAVGVGECTITTTIVADTTATAEDAGVDSEMLVVPENAKAETKVTVGKAIESITLDSNEGVLTVGNTHTIKATVFPEDATDKAVTWKSSDESIATVDAEGNVTAKDTGNVTIMAVNSDGDVSSTYELTVNKVAAKPATNYSGTTSSAGAATTPSYTAPSAPSASTPTYVPAPAPAPAPDPAPAPAPAEPSQPSGGNSGGGIAGSYGGDYLDQNPEFGYSSGIDWTQGATRS